MGSVMPFRRPINWEKLRTDEAERVVRERAREGKTGNVILSDHTWDRVSEREITRKDIFRILREGHCLEDPIKNEKGNWQVIIVKRIAGSREAGVVTVILDDEEGLVVRTVEWMDLR